MGPKALLRGSDVLLIEGSRKALSGWNVLRLLPRRAEPAKASRDSGASGMETLELERRRAVFLDRSDIFMGGRRNQLSVSDFPHVAPWRARYLAGLDRQYQQPPHYECGVPARPAPRASQALGAREIGRR